MLSLAVLSRCVVLLGLVLAQVALAVPVNEKREAVPPASDPFYQPPAGFQNKPPGTILRERKVNAAILSLIPDPVDTYQLLYRTTAINGSAIATVTTIFRPQNASTDRFVSVQIAYDSSATVCNPSYFYQLGSVPANWISSLEALEIQGYLLAGYIVASPDYEGADAAFTAGRLSGTGVLDSMRAVINYRKTLGLSSSTPQVVGVGYSGGAIATGWAASLQKKYAPELRMKGWAMGGTPANLTGTAVYIDDTIFSGFLPALLVGLNMPSAYRAKLNSLINAIITPNGQSYLDYARANCAPEDVAHFQHQSIFSTKFQTLGPALLYHPSFASVLKQNTMGVNSDETPTAPVLIYHATPDEVVPYNDATKLRDSWCRFGASVHFTTYAKGGHLSTAVLGFTPQFRFIQAAFAGTVQHGCSSDTKLNNTLDPLALGVQLEPVFTHLLNTLGDVEEHLSNTLGDLGEQGITVVGGTVGGVVGGVTGILG